MNDNRIELIDLTDELIPSEGDHTLKIEKAMLSSTKSRLTLKLKSMDENIQFYHTLFFVKTSGDENKGARIILAQICKNALDIRETITTDELEGAYFVANISHTKTENKTFISIKNIRKANEDGQSLDVMFNADENGENDEDIPF